MEIELFVHIAHIDELNTGRPVNCKINYAGQYDVKITIDPKKYVIISSNSNTQNQVTIRRKTIIDKLGLRKLFKIKM